MLRHLLQTLKQGLALQRFTPWQGASAAHCLCYPHHPGPPPPRTSVPSHLHTPTTSHLPVQTPHIHTYLPHMCVHWDGLVLVEAEERHTCSDLGPDAYAAGC